MDRCLSELIGVKWWISLISGRKSGHGTPTKYLLSVFAAYKKNSLLSDNYLAHVLHDAGLVIQNVHVKMGNTIIEALEYEFKDNNNRNVKNTIYDSHRYSMSQHTHFPSQMEREDISDQDLKVLNKTYRFGIKAVRYHLFMIT